VGKLSKAETEKHEPTSRVERTAARQHGLAMRPPPYGIARVDRDGLPESLKSSAESLSGLALDDVRVHRDSVEPTRVRALAFTRGSDIHLGPGQNRHLAHELWHVVQQKQGRVSPSLHTDGIAINTDCRLEREAEVMGARVAGGHIGEHSSLRTVTSAASPTMQLLSKGDFAVLAPYGLDVATWAEFRAVLATLSARYILNDISSKLLTLRSSSTTVAVDDLEQAYTLVQDRLRTLGPPPPSGMLGEAPRPVRHSASVSTPAPDLASSATPMPSLSSSSSSSSSAMASPVLVSPARRWKAGPQIDKAELARAIQAALRGFPLFLSGGGAASLLGGPRPIKDLDFRVEMPPDRTFRTDDELSQGLIDGINEVLQQTFDEIQPLTRSDSVTGMTIAGEVLGVEVSITRTPAVEYMSMGPGPSGVQQLGEFDLLLDTAYSFAMRRKTDFEKRVTDLIDMLALIERQPGLMAVFAGLDRLRGAAYQAQLQSLARRTAVERESSLLREFNACLAELIDTKQNRATVRGIMRKYGAEHLFGLIDGLIRATDKQVADQVQVEVI